MRCFIMMQLQSQDSNESLVQSYLEVVVIQLGKLCVS